MMSHESRTYSFETRLPDPKQMMSVSGLDYLRGILAGDYPAAAISATLNFFPTEFEQGRQGNAKLPAIFEMLRNGYFPADLVRLCMCQCHRHRDSKHTKVLSLAVRHSTSSYLGQPNRLP